jgi:hypothetical protein
LQDSQQIHCHGEQALLPAVPFFGRLDAAKYLLLRTKWGSRTVAGYSSRIWRTFITIRPACAEPHTELRNQHTRYGLPSSNRLKTRSAGRFLVKNRRQSASAQCGTAFASVTSAKGLGRRTIRYRPRRSVDILSTSLAEGPPGQERTTKSVELTQVDALKGQDGGQTF